MYHISPRHYYYSIPEGQTVQSEGKDEHCDERWPKESHCIQGIHHLLSTETFCRAGDLDQGLER